MLFWIMSSNIKNKTADNSRVFTPSTKKNSIHTLTKNIKACKPVVLSHDIPPATKLTFVDISHSLCTLDIESRYNKFGALIESANEWLQKNYLWKVENCETVGLVFKSERLDPMDFGATQRLIQTTHDCDVGDCIFLKGLRLWIARREDMPEMRKYVDLQTLAYQTFVPQGCRFYENQIGWQQLDDVVDTINDSLSCGHIRGQLLNIESVNYDADDDWMADTECPKQKEFSDQKETALRVYYVTNGAQDRITEEVTVFDFIPDFKSTGNPPKFEPFCTLLYKLQEFLEENPDYKYLNSQSFDIGFRSLDDIHSHYMIHYHDMGYYLRILRLVCTKPSTRRHKVLERQTTIEITTHPNEVQGSEELKAKELEKRFSVQSETRVLDQKEDIFNIESHCFEIIHQNNTLHGPFYPVKRAIEEFMQRPEWMAYDDCRPERRWKYLCAETVAVLAKDETEVAKKVEMSLFSNRHSLFRHVMPKVLSVVRIFYDTCDVIAVRSAVKPLTKSRSESFNKFDKRFKALALRHQSLPANAIRTVDEKDNSDKKSFKNRVIKSMTCSVS